MKIKILETPTHKKGSARAKWFTAFRWRLTRPLKRPKPSNCNQVPNYSPYVVRNHPRIPMLPHLVGRFLIRKLGLYVYTGEHRLLLNQYGK